MRRLANCKREPRRRARWVGAVKGAAPGEAKQLPLLYRAGLRPRLDGIGAFVRRCRRRETMAGKDGVGAVPRHFRSQLAPARQDAAIRRRGGSSSTKASGHAGAPRRGSRETWRHGRITTPRGSGSAAEQGNGHRSQAPMIRPHWGVPLGWDGEGVAPRPRPEAHLRCLDLHAPRRARPPGPDIPAKAGLRTPDGGQSLPAEDALPTREPASPLINRAALFGRCAETTGFRPGRSMSCRRRCGKTAGSRPPAERTTRPARVAG